MAEDSIYQGLLGGDSSQWAFGTDFEDPLAGVDTRVPAGLDPDSLARYCLGLGDDALVLSQRLSEWCSRAPELEDDVALANLALDLLGQARLLLARAAAASPGSVPVLPEGSPAPAEDALAFFREAHEFRNVRLVELPNGDFAHVVVRLLMFSVVRLDLLERLRSHRDPVLAAVAARGAREIAYHRDWSGRWFLTLAQGTAESRRRLLSALDELWPYWDELVRSSTGTQPPALDQVFALSGVERPTRAGLGGPGGRDGLHTEALGLMLAEMQVVARAHPLGALVNVQAARAAAGEVTDPEMPMLTLEDLGVLRGVEIEDGVVVAAITPTYLGCPAMATMRDDLVHRLLDAGFRRVEVRVVLDPPWSSDWITERGRQALREHGLSAPGAAPARPVRLNLGAVRRNLTCPRCGSARTRLTAEFGATACKALYRCADCLEPFEHVKEI